MPDWNSLRFTNGVFQTVFFRFLTSACDRGRPFQRDKDCQKIPVFSSILVPPALAAPRHPLSTQLLVLRKRRLKNTVCSPLGIQTVLTSCVPFVFPSCPSVCRQSSWRSLTTRWCRNWTRLLWRWSSLQRRRRLSNLSCQKLQTPSVLRKLGVNQNPPLFLGRGVLDLAASHITQRAQRLKKFKISLRDWNIQATNLRLKFSIEIEHFNRDWK